ncbi:MAG: nitrate/nitrite transporter NrtS [Rhodobacteraceae bacterium]|nr:nitrate/nitrite transporter NrtS [Paracoccaceae bacterium]
MTQKSFWHVASSPAVRGRALRIAAIVGTVLIAINHGDNMIMGTMTWSNWLKCGLTYLVPFCVSSYSSAKAMQDQAQAA